MTIFFFFFFVETGEQPRTLIIRSYHEFIKFSPKNISRKYYIIWPPRSPDFISTDRVHSSNPDSLIQFKDMTDCKEFFNKSASLAVTMSLDYDMTDR